MSSEYLNGRIDMMEEFSEDLKYLRQSLFTHAMAAEEGSPDEKYLLAIRVTLRIFESNLTRLSDETTTNKLIELAESLGGICNDQTT